MGQFTYMEICNHCYTGCFMHSFFITLKLRKFWNRVEFFVQEHSQKKNNNNKTNEKQKIKKNKIKKRKWKREQIRKKESK